MPTSLKELFVNDYVRGDDSTGVNYGRVQGYLAGANNPKVLVRIYESLDGAYIPTDNYISYELNALTRLKDLDDLEELEDSEDDDIESDDDIEGDIDYLTSRLDFEKDLEEDDSQDNIAVGDLVTWEVSGDTFTGRVLEIVTDSNNSITSTSGFKLDGNEQDPAVLIRLYARDETNTLVESNLKVTHRISSLIRSGKASHTSLQKQQAQIKENKTFAFNILETKEVDIDGVKYGIVRGYASTYGNVDRGYDVVIQGAFDKSLERYRQTNRPIKMYFNHDSNDIIGGFPVDKIKDDVNGLYVEGQINLEVQRGREAYALAKQGVMQDFSIGYTIDDYDLKGRVRELKQLELWEISMVGEPMNTEARILSVKKAMPFKDYPLASPDHEWDSAAAIQRVKDFTDAKDAPNAKFAQSFMYVDEEDSENFGSYKLPYVDVVDGSLKAVPRAIYAIAGALKGARGGVDIPADDKAKIITNVNRYYEKMDMASPFTDSKKSVRLKHVLSIENKRDLEKLLRDSGAFSKKAAVYLSSLLPVKQSDSALEPTELIELRKLINYINTGKEHGL